ncbi:MAG: response regulator [Acidiferrobacteraceae bacterium]
MTFRPRILIADDSRVIRKVIAQILKSDFDLIEKEDGEAAWQALQSDTVDVVITDMEMPRMDGCGLLSRLRTSDRSVLQNLPVIVITGAEDDETKNRAFECGATDFITKPIDRIQLLARVRGQARLERANRELSAIAASSPEDMETGASNKRGLLTQGASDLAYAKRHGTGLAVIRLNIAVTAGSLQTVTTQLRSHMRREDTLGYLGNQAFAILSPCSGPQEAVLLSARLKRGFMGLRPAGVELVSYGMVSADGADGDTSELLMAAEVAMEPCEEAPETTAVPDLAQAEPDWTGEPEVIVEIGESVLEQEEPSVTINVSGIDAVIETAIEPPSQESEPPVHVGHPAASRPPTLDTALEMIRAGHFDALRPHLRALALKSLPLIELYGNGEDSGLAPLVRLLRDKLTQAHR